MRDVGNLFVYVEQLVAKFSDGEDKASLMYQANSILLVSEELSFKILWFCMKTNIIVG